MQAIKTVNLTKRYKDLTAVRNLNLIVERGEIFSLLGVNGAGKTTTIKMLSCLTKPTGGDAFLEGSSVVTNATAVKQQIAVSPPGDGGCAPFDGKGKPCADVWRPWIFKRKAEAENG